MHTRPFAAFISILAITALGCSLAPSGAHPTPQSISRDQAPGVPNQPDLVTVISFVTKVDLNAEEKTKVVIPIELDGHRGNVVLDLGDPDGDFNRTFLQPGPNGGIDTVRDTTNTDLHRQPDWDGADSVHTTLRLGTLAVTPPNYPGSRFNAVLDHAFNNFATFAPRLGNLGLTALEPFETIIDYTRQQVVLIRLDKNGHRMVDVPLYTSTWSAPLIDMPHHWWGVRMLLGGVVPDSAFFDTGNETNDFSPAITDQLQGHLMHQTLDSVLIGGRSFPQMAFETDPSVPADILGYPFLHQLGIVGFNHRTHQFLLYR